MILIHHLKTLLHQLNQRIILTLIFLILMHGLGLENPIIQMIPGILNSCFHHRTFSLKL